MSGLELGLFTAISAAGTLTSTVANIAGGVSKAEALKKEAGLKNLQADELLSRQAINEEAIREQGERLALGYGASFASTGRDGGGIGGMLRIKKDIEDNISNNRREAEFKAKMLRAGADVDLSLSSDSITSGLLTGTGTLLGGIGSLYKQYRDYDAGPSKPKPLPG